MTDSRTGASSRVRAAWLRRAVRAWDAFLRRRLGVFDYSTHPRVFLRLQLTRAPRPLTLADGTRIARGDRVAALHFLNEKVPHLSEQGADLQWGLGFARGLAASLQELQRYLTSRPDLADVRLVQAHVGFVEEKDLQRTVALAGKFGLEFVAKPAAGLRFWTPAFWETLGGWIMVWTFNPPGLKGKHFRRLLNAEIRMSRAALDRRYGKLEQS